MVRNGEGRILVTGSIVGFLPWPFHAAYNAGRAFIHSFTAALRNVLKGASVTVMCLMSGPARTNAFARAGMRSTFIGSNKKPQMDPAEVAAVGLRAMQNGQAYMVAGWLNKIIVLVSKIFPAQAAEIHRQTARPC